MRKRTGAYMTVEAVLILPIVFGVILLVIYLWFYQYDRCLMEQDAGMLAMRGAAMGAEDYEERMEATKSLLAENYAGKYVAWEDLGTDIKIAKGKISVKQKGSIPFPFSGLAFWDGESLWKMSVSYENELLSPASILRKYRNVMGGK